HHRRGRGERLGLLLALPGRRPAGRLRLLDRPAHTLHQPRAGLPRPVARHQGRRERPPRLSCRSYLDARVPSPPLPHRRPQRPAGQRGRVRRAAGGAPRLPPASLAAPISTLAFLVRRVLSAVLSVLLASVVVVGALLAVPGDPATVLLGMNASPAAREALRTQLGLDRPPVERYVSWLGGVMRGDMGESLNYQRPVAGLIGERLRVSVPLAVGAALVACLLALPLGIFAALRRGTVWDPLVTSLSQLGAAIPSFWLGLIFILYFAVELR